MSFPDSDLRPGQDALPDDGAVVTAGPLTPPPDSAGTPADDKAFHHSVAEDVQGMVLASLVAALGMSLFAQGGVMIGGMAGVSLLLHYALGWNFGLVFVLSNLPFYWIAVRRMGWEFTLKTFVAVGATGLLTDLLPRWIRYAHVDTWFSALVGGALCGLGILAVYLQRERGWSAGKVQLAFDAVLMAVALAVLSPAKVAYSALGAVVLSLVLTFNHRPNRYMGV